MGIIRNLFHVSLQAADWDKALNFYKNTLGFDQAFELNVGQFKDMLGLGTHDEGDAEHWLTYLRVAPDEYIEMFNSVINPPDFTVEKLGRHSDSFLQSYGLGCENLSETMKELEARGVKIADGFEGKYIMDPSGVKIRLVERKGHSSEKKRLFTSLAGISIYVNDLPLMKDHLEKMTLDVKEESDDRVLFGLGNSNHQYVEILKADHPVKAYDDDLLGHFALTVKGIGETVKTWGENGAYCCSQPFLRNQLLPIDGSAKGNIGLDRCEIVWMVCPEGNKIEVMVEPGNTMQQEFERTHSY